MTAYVLRISDWSSDVCSSDLCAGTRVVVSSIELAGIGHQAVHLGHGSELLALHFGRAAGDQQECVRPVAPRLTDRLARLAHGDRKSVVSGKRVAVRDVVGGRRMHTKKKQNYGTNITQK